MTRPLAKPKDQRVPFEKWNKIKVRNNYIQLQYVLRPLQTVFIKVLSNWMK